jgi:HindIII restriction endonuclease
MMALLVDQVIHVITALCKDKTLDFRGRSERLKQDLDSCTEAEILEHLDEAGLIPECFDHDSTEEKLFAKYCDYLLAASWSALGMEAEAILERTDAADVAARVGEYRVVGDAKAFRLSRTAKNQKDFKVEALDKWRKGAQYACLVCPLYQYPS